jgi:hypothetical protein
MYATKTAILEFQTCFYCSVDKYQFAEIPNQHT